MLTPHITVKSEDEGAIFTVVCAFSIFVLLERTQSILSKVAVHWFSNSREWRHAHIAFALLLLMQCSLLLLNNMLNSEHLYYQKAKKL